MAVRRRKLRPRPVGAAGPGDLLVYDPDPTPICWLFRREGASAFAALLVEGGAETGFRLELARVADDPLPCPAPPVGS